VKAPFGAKLAGSYTRSMRWIAANHKKEGATPASMIDENCRPPRLMIVEFGMQTPTTTVQLNSKIGVISTISYLYRSSTRSWVNSWQSL
jgi:hypothetical protein